MNKNSQIKFRVWDVDLKKFVGGEQIYFISDLSNHYQFNSSAGCICGTKSKPKEYILQRFIGILGADKKEIYEGDILRNKYTKDIYEVVFNDFGSFVCKYFDKKTNTLLYCPFIGSNRELEIIGNIFEKCRCCGQEIRLESRVENISLHDIKSTMKTHPFN